MNYDIKGKHIPDCFHLSYFFVTKALFPSTIVLGTSFDVRENSSCKFWLRRTSPLAAFRTGLVFKSSKVGTPNTRYVREFAFLSESSGVKIHLSEIISGGPIDKSRYRYFLLQIPYYLIRTNLRNKLFNQLYWILCYCVHFLLCYSKCKFIFHLFTFWVDYCQLFKKIT